MVVLAAFVAPCAAEAARVQGPERAGMFHHSKSGTAFFVDDSGTLLTARHAVEDCVRVVVTKEGGSVAARVVALSNRFDLGLIKIPRTLGISAVFPRNDAGMAANDMVFASAYDKLADMTHRGGTVANATVSSGLDGRDGGSLVIDSDVSFGASGAPVLDSRGLVEGVISARTGFTKVLAVGERQAKEFLVSNDVRVNEDDRPQLAGGASRANRAASISALVTCLQD